MLRLTPADLPRRAGASVLIAAALSACAGAALAHPIGEHVTEAAPGWSFEAWVIGPLVLSGLLYAAGWLRLAGRSGAGRAVLVRRAALFAAGWICLVAAAVSPLHEAGARSFAAHMLEHELLMLAAAPLLVLSWPIAAMLWAFPAPARQALAGVGRSRLVGGPWRLLTDPWVATAVQAAALWLWHLPSLFDLALRSEPWHAAQHLSFLVSALFFWTAMLNGRRDRRSLGKAALCLFLTSVVSGALGAFMALSSSPWYPRYAAMGMTPWGLTPAEDQQLAGLLMWIPGGLVHAVAALLMIGAALTPAREGRRPAPDETLRQDAHA
jgi:cytochrome c oxidase assembly factor CtaG